jgi:hypothetical protein
LRQCFSKTNPVKLQGLSLKTLHITFIIF